MNYGQDDIKFCCQSNGLECENIKLECGNLRSGIYISLILISIMFTIKMLLNLKKMKRSKYSRLQDDEITDKSSIHSIAVTMTN